MHFEGASTRNENSTIKGRVRPMGPSEPNRSWEADAAVGEERLDRRPVRTYIRRAGLRERGRRCDANREAFERAGG